MRQANLNVEIKLSKLRLMLLIKLELGNWLIFHTMLNEYDANGSIRSNTIQNSDESTKRFKARLVAKVHNQIELTIFKIVITLA